MGLLNVIYAVSCGFGVAFLAIQFFFTLDDDVDDSGADQTSDDFHDFDHASDTDYDTADHDIDHHGSEIHTDDVAHHAETSEIGSGFMSFLTFLRWTRKLTYFCAGFGTMGLFCVMTKVPVLTGLIYSLVVGTISLIISTLIFKLIKPGSSGQNYRIKSKDLTGCYAEVISKIGPDETALGEIKISLDKNIVNLYALPNNSGTTFKKGDLVTVYKVNKKGYALVEPAKADELNVDLPPELKEEDRDI